MQFKRGSSQKLFGATEKTCLLVKITRNSHNEKA